MDDKAHKARNAHIVTKKELADLAAELKAETGHLPVAAEDLICDPPGELSGLRPARPEDLRTVPARDELRPDKAIERMLKRNV